LGRANLAGNNFVAANGGARKTRQGRKPAAAGPPLNDSNGANHLSSSMVGTARIRQLYSAAPPRNEDESVEINSSRRDLLGDGRIVPHHVECGCAKQTSACNSALLDFLLMLLVPAYFVLQPWALFKLRDKWRIAAALPL
jgi:hypothetical protein